MAKKTTAGKLVNGIGDDAVREKTGRNWAEWFTVLDRAGAAKMTHKEIAAYLGEKENCPSWWRQMIAVGFEQERGLRDKHQKPDGYSVSASKTIAVAVDRLFEAWSDEKLRARWLPNAKMHIRKATAPKSLRISWDDGETSVQVLFYAKGAAKSQVAVEHDKLPDADTAAGTKAFWTDALERLKGELE